MIHFFKKIIMDNRVLHLLSSISTVVILYQKFLFSMKSIKSDTVKNGKLLFDRNVVQWHKFGKLLLKFSI